MSPPGCAACEGDETVAKSVVKDGYDVAPGRLQGPTNGHSETRNRGGGMQITKSGQCIECVDDWFHFAPPKGGLRHWKDGRSAKELARAWVGAGNVSIPSELLEILTSHPDTSSPDFVCAEPEALIRFDTRRGEVRNADLAISARANSVPIAITIEAKADEPFDDLISNTLANAVDRFIESGVGEGLERVRDLAKSLLPASKGLPRLKDLRYQLLTAAAGSLAWASKIGAPRAVMIIHEFQTNSTSMHNLERNARDLDSFVKRLASGHVDRAQHGKLLGPFRVPGDPLFPKAASLYIGKITSLASAPDATGGRSDRNLRS